MKRLEPSGLRVATIEETYEPGLPGRWSHPGWMRSFPWLVQGVTDRGRPEGSQSWDFATVSETGGDRLAGAWVDLYSHLDFRGVTYARQVHGSTVLIHEGSDRGWGAEYSGPSRPSPGVGSPLLGEGLDLPQEADGHLTREPGLLLGVTLADCVPVFLVEPSEKVVGVLHAGWRGVSAGVLEEGIGLLRDRFSLPAQDLHLHLGPSICGRCYQVGPEVHRALGLEAPDLPGPLDLRAVLADRALGMGLRPSLVTRSPLCTRCGESRFFSHRGGDRGRQAGFIGIRSTVPKGGKGRGDEW